MKHVVFKAMGIFLLMVATAAGSIFLYSTWGKGTPSAKDLGVADANAASQDLKTGSVDPATGKKIKYWVAPMDPTYIRYEPGKSPMGMDLVPVYQESADEEKTPSSTIRIDPVTIQNMGIRTGRITRGPLYKTITSFGTVTYNESKIHAVNLKFNGWIETLHVDFVGETVKKGQPLFKIYSPDLVTAQEEYLLALDQEKRLAGSPYNGISDSARRLLEASRTRLRYLDLTDDQIRRIESSGKVEKTLTIFSPANGVVIAKTALAGHFVKTGEHLYEIADLSTIWVDAEVYEYELPWIRKGMAAQMILPYAENERLTGKVRFVYPYVEPKTRTTKLRIEFPNPGYRLKPNMYANVLLTATLSKNSLLVPQEAVINSGVRSIVFIDQGKGKFEPREVKIGIENSDHRLQVLDGLKEGEQVVISAQFMLDSESRLREAIQKMLAVKNGGGSAPSQTSLQDLDMEGMTMAPPAGTMDDLDLSGITMDKG